MMEQEKRRLKRLSAREQFQISDWFKTNFQELKKIQATRLTAATMATEALGINVRISSIETAEAMIGATLPNKLKPAPRLKNSDVVPVLEDLKKQVKQIEDLRLKVMSLEEELFKHIHRTSS